MTSIPLRLGALESAKPVLRSGIRWLREEGQLCKRGEVLAFCNIGFPLEGASQKPAYFVDEVRDFQVAFLAPASGRLRKERVTLGGFLDRHQYYQRWSAESVIGHLELRPGERRIDSAESEMPLLMLAGRRVTELAEDRRTLLSGWHDRARVWRGDAPGTPATVLSLGICEQSGIFLGESDAFLELASMLGPSTHMVWNSDYLLVPSVRVLLEQFRRTPEEMRSISADLATHLPQGSAVPTASDWMFAGSLISGLARSPLLEEYDILTRAGVTHATPAETIVLSLFAEQANQFKHRRLGYTVSLHGFRILELGPAATAWLHAEFEPVFRSADEIYEEYVELIDAVRQLRPARFLVFNLFSSSASDQFYSYAAFDAPLGRTIGSVRAKELNLMLYELARQRDITIIDADVVIATLGARAHLPDGVHQSGAVQSALREELVRYVS